MTIDLVISARRRDLGGFEVGRVLPWSKRRMVGPFIFFDHIGPVHLKPDLPRSMDVRPHPHICLSTITYLFAGEIVHRDSLGCYQVIRPGEVNWMTAGRGISHSERFETMREQGGFLHGIQAWVALPQEAEEVTPAFAHFDADSFPDEQRDDVRIRLIAGTAFDLISPVQTHSPLVYAHLEMGAGARVVVPADYTERALFVADGSLLVEGVRYEPGQMFVLAAGATPEVIAMERTTAMLLGGEPLGERHIWWNFVSSRPERIEQAKADWRAGKIPLPVGDDAEFIALPEEAPAQPPPRPEPMS